MDHIAWINEREGKRTVTKLNAKIVLITGGASGLGKAIAECLVRDGARVVITDVQHDFGKSVADQHGFTFIEQDVTDESRWNGVVEEVCMRHGGLHVLVNNAGILSPEHATPEDSLLMEWRKLFQVNVEGVFLGCRAAIPAIHASGGGSIINISSVAGLLATPFAMAYGASKAAVRQMTKSVAQHCVERKLNIRCNSVHPGIVRTPSWERHAADESSARGVPIEVIFAEAQAAIPMGSWTTPEDVASAVSFLASEQARHITGAKFVIDGGLVHCDTYHAGLAK